MKHFINIPRVICLAIALVGSFGFSATHTYAGTEFMTSWSAKTYAPAWYTGKVFPVYQSFVTVAFELVENGKMVDLSKTIVQWYVNDTMLRNETNGLGIKKFTLYNQQYNGDIINVKIAIPNYKGSALQKTIDIKVKNPEVVIDVPYFEKRVPKGDATVFAWPFFFNATRASELGLQWNTEGAPQPGVLGEALTVKVGDDVSVGTQYRIGATIGNKKKPLESMVSTILIETK